MSDDLGKRLFTWDKNYRLEADLVRCAHCKRGMHFAHAADALHHRFDCKLSGNEDRPWQMLVALVGAVGQAKTPVSDSIANAPTSDSMDRYSMRRVSDSIPQEDATARE